MFRQDTAPGSTKPRLIRGGILVVMILSVITAVPSNTQALSRFGPDPADTGAAAGQFADFLVTSPGYTSATVPLSKVPIYYRTPLGTKAIRITGADFCKDPEGTAPTAGNNQWDTFITQVTPAGNPATLFYVSHPTTNVRQTLHTSVASVARDCFSNSITVTFNGPAFLEFDNTINRYYAFFNAQALATLFEAQNRYRIELLPDPPAGPVGQDVGAIVGYSSNGDSSSFGVSHSFPNSGTRHYRLPFAPDCNVNADTWTYVELYDMDNGQNPQGGRQAITYIEETPPTGTPVRIPLTFTTTDDRVNGPPVGIISGGPNGYVLDSGDRVYAYAHFQAKPGYKYILGMENVFYNNILQFQLPYDSIYSVETNCSPVVPPPPPPPPPPPLPRQFFETNGGDVVTGASFATGPAPAELCTAAPHITTAGIVSWNLHGSPSYLGAGGQYAAMALGFVQDYSTGQGNGRQPAGAETNQLTFANTNVAAGGQNSIDLPSGFFGGMFGDAPCADYWNNQPPTMPLVPATVNPAALGDGAYRHTGNLTLTAGTLTAGRRVTIYVEGDVSITGDITYAPYATRAGIPQFKLIVKGAIFIQGATGLTPAVGRLDGLYAAIPDANYATNATVNNYADPVNGTISTCSTGFSSYSPTGMPGNSLYANCNRQLVVTGSVVAHQLWLLRTFGDLDVAAVRQPAEIFNYSPEMWLVPASGGSGSSSGYQSVIGLPPIL